MKIGIIVQDITKLGGVETVSIWLADVLGKKNEVDIISCKKQNNNTFNASQMVNIEYLGIPIGHKFFTNEDYLVLENLLHEKRYDRVIVQLSTAFKNLCFVANTKLYKRISKFSRLYICIHGSPKYFITRYNTSYDGALKFLVKRIYHCIRYKTEIKSFFYKSKKYITNFITLSKGCHDELKKYYGIESIVRYNPYHFDNSEISTDAKENIVLWAGRLSPEKNILLLLKAWSAISDYKNWKLRIIGSGEQEQLLKQFIIDNDIKNVEMIPAMPHVDLIEQFKKSKIFVLTSFFEGFPTVICEAMNYKNAVISTRYDGFSNELLDEKTGIFLPFDSRMLADSISSALRDKELLLSYQTAGYKRCEKFYKLLKSSNFQYFN